MGGAGLPAPPPCIRPCYMIMNAWFASIYLQMKGYSIFLSFDAGTVTALPRQNTVAYPSDSERYDSVVLFTLLKVDRTK